MVKLLKSPFAKIFLLFVIWRCFLFLVAFFAPNFIPQFGARFPYFEERLIASKLPHFIWSFGNFDGVHYIGIAKDGYAYQFTQAFFPFYPILMKIVSFVTFGNFLIAGLVVSNIAFLIGLFIFYKLVKKTHNENIAYWSCLFLLSFPTSFYFGAVYTEGLFFMLIISSFYLYDQKKIWQASIVGAFASATRLIGIFLAPAFSARAKTKFHISLLIIPLGLISYMIFLKLEFNNPFYFLTAQTIFGQERSTTQIILLPQVFYRYLKILTTTSGLVLATAAFELISTIFALSLLLIAYKKVKIEWLIFSVMAVITPTLTGTFASMPRYILIAFPIFIVLGSIKNVAVKIFILIIFLVLLTVATIFFSQGYWVA